MSGQFDLGAITPQRYFFGIAVILGLLFASVGEVDDGTSLFLHFLIWQLQTIIPMGLFVVCHVFIGKIAGNTGLNSWLQLVISGALGAVLFTPLNLGIDVLLQGEALSERTLLTALLGEILSMGPPAMISWIAINAPWVLGFRFETARAGELSTAVSARENNKTAKGAKSTGDADSTAEVNQPRFLSLVPDSKRGELVSMKADLHYLSVITSKGQSLLLYNLRDAINEVPEGMGLQCHRSYWANLDQVVAFEKRGRQGVLKLSDGSEIPVSRNYMGLVTQTIASRQTSG